jgi:sugar phosphate isomerase/epimerase
MKLGISSYCLSPYLRRGEMTIYEVIDWAKAHDAEHLELVPFGLPLLKENGDIDEAYVNSIREHAEKVGMPLSAFSLNACVIKPTEEERREEIARIEKYMNICKMLGIKKMRHDCCSGQHPQGINTPEQFEKDFPTFVAAVQELADYGATIGLSSTLENHGLYVNGADRLIRLLCYSDFFQYVAHFSLFSMNLIDFHCEFFEHFKDFVLFVHYNHSFDSSIAYAVFDRQCRAGSSDRPTR